MFTFIKTNHIKAMINLETPVIFLDKPTHRYAEQFAAQQETIYKGKQVYLNTLAVCAVSTYLQCLSLKTSLAESDCWQPELRAIFNLADLVLPGVGKLECCPLLPGEKQLTLAPEVTDNRLGYVAVKFSEQLNQVEILGFTPANKLTESQETIPLTELESLDTLLDIIYNQKVKTRLMDWLGDIFPKQWQPLEPLLTASGRNFRSSIIIESAKTISRGQVFVWEIDGQKHEVILAVKISSDQLKNQEEININLQLIPFGASSYLPEGLKIIILDEANEICMEAGAKKTDQLIELEFSGQIGEKFSVKIVLGETSITEQFLI